MFANGFTMSCCCCSAVASFCSGCNASFSQQGDPALLSWLLWVGLTVFFWALWSFLLFGRPRGSAVARLSPVTK